MILAIEWNPLYVGCNTIWIVIKRMDRNIMIPGRVWQNYLKLVSGSRIHWSVSGLPASRVLWVWIRRSSGWIPVDLFDVPPLFHVSCVQNQRTKRANEQQQKLYFLAIDWFVAFCIDYCNSVLPMQLLGPKLDSLYQFGCKQTNGLNKMIISNNLGAVKALSTYSTLFNTGSS